MPASSQAEHGIDGLLGIRRQCLPYVLIWVLYYAWVIVFTTWWTAMPDSATPFDSSARSLIHGVNLLSSAVFVLAARRTWHVRMACIGGACITAGMLAYLIAPSPSVHIASALLIALSMGCVNIAILMPFVFAMNDSERLCSVAGSNILIYLLLLARQLLAIPDAAATASSLVLLASSLCVLPFFRRAGRTQEAPADKPAPLHTGRFAYFALALSCIFAFLGRGVMKGLLEITPSGPSGLPQMLFLAASLAGAALYFALHWSRSGIRQLSWNNQLPWNITFGFLAAAFVLYAFCDSNPLLLAPFALCAGLGNTMGMCGMYYLLGLFGNRLDSLRYVRLSIVLIGICGGISGVVIGNLIAGEGFPSLTVAVSIISSIVVLALLTASPLLSRMADDAQPVHASDENSQPADPFCMYGLSKRESEVCELLLQGYTMRQIASKLSIAHSTVNTYCTSLYRKTGVNSRAELMLLFRNHLRS